MRLIDEDALKATLLEYGYTTEHNQIFRYIDEQPTAYDIDKVVEELESIKNGGDCRNKCKYYDWSVGSCEGHCNDYIKDKAIEIVKQGDVSDDVCDWKKEPSRLVGYFRNETSCGDSIDLQGNSELLKAFRYCPFCGKKIKVVE